VCSFRNLAKTNPHPQDRVQLFDEEFGVKAFMNVGADPAFGGAGAAHGAGAVHGAGAAQQREAAGDDGRVLDGGPEPVYAEDTFCWAHLLIAKTWSATVSLQPPFHCQTGEAALSLQRFFDCDASHTAMQQPF